jgi:carbon starvation protein
MQPIKRLTLWLAIALLGAFAFATVALHRGETVSAIWLVVAALSVFIIAYRFYSYFIAKSVLELDANRPTPATQYNDGLDYIPTHKWVTFGHHFAAIAGAGPLVGPVLAAQMGYLPGTLWLLVGVVLAGAVQDTLVLFLSIRRDGKSLGEIIRTELGIVPGIVASGGILIIMVILLAVLALVVVKALVASPWGTFTIAMTIPIALFMGIYSRFIRPGRIGEVSIIGFILLILAIVYGGDVAQNETVAPFFTLSGTQLAWAMMIYGFIASVLPVWLLLAPRDYLSTFLKIGTIIALAIGILIAAPHLRMPSVTSFIDGSGPVFAGSLFPFLFITLACGAVSGFHSLVASGTTPKLVENETQVRLIGYGAMLVESFVAIMALIAASILEPGVYFALNSPAALIGHTVQEAAHSIGSWGFFVTPNMLAQVAKDVGETSILSRAGGAPTLAVGMAHILSTVIGGKAMMAFWYHFAILFEALFILTTVDAGTRVARFMIQDFIGYFYKPMAATQSWWANMGATALAVAAWGYFLYQGVIDPLGGINTLWPLFGIANQMLAGIALTLATVVLLKMQKIRYIWVTLLPMLFLVVVTLTAGWQKLFDNNPKIGFLAHARIFSASIDEGKVLAPAKDIAQMQQIVMNDYIDAVVTAILMTVVISMLLFGINTARRTLAVSWPIAKDPPTVF